MNEKQLREIGLRQTSYAYAQELAIAANQGAFVGASGAPTLPDTKGVIEQAKLIYEYFTKGK